MFIKARDRERSTNVYMCDALWVISGALGNELPRYSDIINKKAVKADKKTSEEVVDGIIKVLKKDLERRQRDGNGGI